MEGKLKHIYFVITVLFLSFQMLCPLAVYPQESAPSSPNVTNQEASPPNTQETTPTVPDFRQSERTLVFPTNEGIAPVADVSLFAIFRILFVLVLVCASIYGVIFFLKHHKKTDTADDTFLKVLARTAITPKTAAAVVSVGKKAYLVGLSDNSVSLISEINDQETVDAMQLAYNAAHTAEITAKEITFNQVLAKIAGIVNKKPLSNVSADNETQNVSEILNQKRKRLKDL